jgi:hypothetical protein
MVTAICSSSGSYWQRAFDAMVEARMRQAERLVQEYQELTKR